MSDELATRRVEYETAGLDVADVAADPVEQWRRWYDEASAAGAVEPNAMVIATVGLDGHPDARTVLARGADDRSVVFFTNYGSAKSRQLDAHPHAAAVFTWLELHRQVRLRGGVERVGDVESDA
ncbi:MAG TPA: pyridoxal 5'-phosphate synthase, partial [Desertimonas sp.]|nr:pyridoxal 5'-phosphate synthase [Desertimonas sp.]